MEVRESKARESVEQEQQRTGSHRTDRVLIAPDRFDAVLFDLDGVVTDTARIHAAAWQRMFNEFLQRRAAVEHRTFQPFTPEDYRHCVDGRPRFDGVRRFLASRGIAVPEGNPDDPPDRDTVYGLGERKTRLFLEAIRTHGVGAYPSTVEMIHRLRASGIRLAVVTASRNREEILRAAGLESVFDAILDGHDREAMRLRGKPAPDTYLEAAHRLGVSPGRAVVIEDATAGVEAGRAGGFGLVIGVDRLGEDEALRHAGADVVVPDLQCVEVAARDPWHFVYDGFDPALEQRRETLLALGNGYFVARGAASESRVDGVHYPGTYLAGGYNRLTSNIHGRPVEHEDLVNLPNWLPLTFRIDDGEWFTLSGVEIVSYRQSLDLRRGVYERIVRIRDGQGRATQLMERRFVHMRWRHLAGQHVAILAENWSGRLTIRAMLDGEVHNAGVLRYRPFEGRHVRVTGTTAPASDCVLLEAETTQSRLRIALVARIRALRRSGRAVERSVVQESSRIGQDLIADVTAGERVEVEKIVALHTSRDLASADPVTDALTTIGRAGSFEELLSTHSVAWDHLWRRCDLDAVEVEEDALHRTHLVVRLHVFHLLQTVSPHTMELDVGVPSRGWHGEAYRGHVFWDDLFIFPFLTLRLPLLARALLQYRFRRLPEARWAAREAGFSGAMFPWQSGSTGREETDVLYYNPRGESWIRDDTHLQRHVGAAIAHNVWMYYQATGDVEYLFVYGAELLLEIGRFWASIATWNAPRQRYDIRGVVGPDEFHVRYPGRSEAGIDNNAYTNLMASWCLARANDVLDLLPEERERELCETLGITNEERARWDEISRKIYLPFLDEGVLSQFEGYESLQEFDWEGYRRKYGDVGRLDLILDAEGDTPDRYKLSKQADVLMLFYLFSSEELQELFARLGYPFDPAVIPRTIDYYLARTSHGSTLSGVVHAWVLSRSDRPGSWSIFLEALRSDIDDIQGGTTPEGIHLGAMAGTVDLLQRCYTGLELRRGQLRLNPVLPEELDRLSFDLRYRKHSLAVDLTPKGITVTSAPGAAAAISIRVNGQHLEVTPGTSHHVVLHPMPDARPGG